MKPSTGNTSAVTVTILAVGALLLVGSALIGITEEISYPETFDFQPSEYDAGVAIVVATSVNEGMKVLGIVLQEPEYLVKTAFAVPGEDCFVALTEQEMWPVPEAPCPGPPGVSGSLSGIGRTAEGDTHVSVTMVVGEECYHEMAPGMACGDAAAACF